MTRFITTIAMAGLLILLATTVYAAEPRHESNAGDAAELKALQAERVEVLTRLVDVLTSQYKVGTADVAQVFSAENDLCNALLDSTDEPAKRIALLTKQLDRTNEFLKITQGRVDAGTAGPADVYRAQSTCLAVKIKLVRERGRKMPAAASPAEKQR